MWRPSVVVCLILWSHFVGDVTAFAPQRSNTLTRSGLPPLRRPLPAQQQQTSPTTKARTIPTTTRSTCTHLNLSTAATTAGFVAAQIILGNVGTYSVIRAITLWYRRIPLPSWTPPDRAFAPVWTTLYVFMGIAASRIYRLTAGTTELRLWFLHVAVNSIWPLVFFGQKNFRLGLLLNVFLTSSMAIILPAFYKIDPISAGLLLPYTAWLAFATKLNQSICKLNPTDKSGYNQAKLESDIAQLQEDAAKYAGC